MRVFWVLLIIDDISLLLVWGWNLSGGRLMGMGMIDECRCEVVVR